MYFPHTFYDIKGSINLGKEAIFHLLRSFLNIYLSGPSYKYAALLKISLGSQS